MKPMSLLLALLMLPGLSFVDSRGVHTPVSAPDVSVEQPAPETPPAQEPPATVPVDPRGVPVPVLMYHHFIPSGTSRADTVVSAQSFERQLQAVKDAGYTAITIQQLVDYVEHSVPLPEKPLLITMDDGYLSNLEVAAPVLERLGMTATVFTIGINSNRDTEAHSGAPLDPPRLYWTDALPWIEKGVMAVQSHTYDMHQRTASGFSGRDGVLQMQGESDQDYRAALNADFSAAIDQLDQALGGPTLSLAFPYGLYSKTAVSVLKELGVKATFTTKYGVVRAVPGNADSIQCMPRFGVPDTMSGQELASRLDKLCRKA